MDNNTNITYGKIDLYDTTTTTLNASIKNLEEIVSIAGILKRHYAALSRLDMENYLNCCEQYERDVAKQFPFLSKEEQRQYIIRHPCKPVISVPYNYVDGNFLASPEFNYA